MQSWLEQISQQCTEQRVRQLVVIPGELSQSWPELQPWLKSQSRNGKTIGVLNSTDLPPTSADEAPFTALKANKPNNLLGYELHHVVANLHHGLYPDALAAVSGTIRAGGLLILLVPEFTQWPQHSDGFSQKRRPHGAPEPALSPAFVQRLIDRFAYWQVPIYHPNQASEPADFTLPIDAETNVSDAFNANSGGVSPDQSKIIQRILETPDCVHVVTADRGRGKSFLLGQLVAQLTQQAVKTPAHNKPEGENKDNGIMVFITAPNKKAVQSVYTGLAAAREQHPPTTDSTDHLDNSSEPNDDINGSLPFLAPEEVLNKTDTDSWLLVDEAASLPIPLLIKWAAHVKHMVFATTTHGYEGTGKGFQVRFFEYLNQSHRGWQHHQLTHPIRYADNDPLEGWLFDTLMLDAEPDMSRLAALDTNACKSREVTQSELASNASLLKQIFGLLINAHYQTKPSDLRDILDAPGLRVFVQSVEYTDQRTQLQHEVVLSACLLTNEGPIEESLWEAICNGHRRPNGHLIPQSLGFYFGLPDAMALRCARVIRIATQPQRQRSQLASALLEFIAQQLQQEGYDILGSSFAATEDVIRFWQKNDFELIKSGSIADHASGTTSALVVKPLSQQSQPILLEARQFYAFLTSETLVAFNELPMQAHQVLKAFANEKGSVETAKLILDRLKNVELPTLPLNKNATNQLREKVRQQFYSC